MSAQNRIASVIVSVVATFGSGCATYVRDRMADVGDIFTATVGTGLGVTAKAGPIHTGLGYSIDGYGMRGGEVGSFFPEKPHGMDNLSGDAAVIVTGFGGFAPKRTRAHARGKAFGSKLFYTGRITPFLDLPWDADAECHPAIDPQWTQIDLSVGLIASVRLGFNPGELLDFIMGLVGFDLYGDDLSGAGDDWETLARKRREEGRAKRRSMRQRELRFDEWSGAGLIARRNWGGWRPELAKAASFLQQASVEQESGDTWRVCAPHPENGSWTNLWRVVVRVRDTPAAARADLFDAYDNALSNYWNATRRGGANAPGDVCFIFSSDHCAFARDCLYVSVDEFSYGRESHALQLALALDAQILEAMR